MVVIYLSVLLPAAAGMLVYLWIRFLIYNWEGGGGAGGYHFALAATFDHRPGFKPKPSAFCIWLRVEFNPTAVAACWR